MNSNNLLIFFIFAIIALLVYYIFYGSTATNDKAEIIKTLVRQAARWSLAAQQDATNLIALLHANYGAGYLWAVNDIATSSEIERATGIDYIKFRDAIVKIQDTATRKVSKDCPGFMPTDSYLAQIAGDV